MGGKRPKRQGTLAVRSEKQQATAKKRAWYLRRRYLIEARAKALGLVRER